MATFIGASAKEGLYHVEPDNGSDFTLGEIRSILGMASDHYIQIVPIPHALKISGYHITSGNHEIYRNTPVVEIVPKAGMILICDEDGYAHGLPPNICASYFTEGCVNGPIVGNVLICESSQVK